jgi:hypothetical protein
MTSIEPWYCMPSPFSLIFHRLLKQWRTFIIVDTPAISASSSHTLLRIGLESWMLVNGSGELKCRAHPRQTTEVATVVVRSSISIVCTAGAELQSWDLKIPIERHSFKICALITPHVADERTLRYDLYPVNLASR